MKTDFLSPKQQLFCDEYLKDFNAYRAALRAGYSAGTALNGQLMTLPKIKLYLQERHAVTAGKAQVDRDEVLAELCKIAFGNMANYYAPDGNLKPMNDLSADEKAALWQTKTDSNGTQNVRMYNKLGALEKIAKILNLYTHEVKQPEKELVYVDKEATTEDDYFDDAELKKDHEVYTDENGSLIYGDGILPYAPVCDVFKFFISEKPETMIARVKYYENMQRDMAANVDYDFNTVDFKTELNNWLDTELEDYNFAIAGDSYDDILKKYTALRDFKRNVNMKMAG